MPVVSATSLKAWRVPSGRMRPAVADDVPELLDGSRLEDPGGAVGEVAGPVPERPAPAGGDRQSARLASDDLEVARRPGARRSAWRVAWGWRMSLPVASWTSSHSVHVERVMKSFVPARAR